MIFLTGGEKGGCCKSTTALCLSGELVYRGYSVGLLDADKKMSAKNWTLVRDELIQYLNDGSYGKILTDDIISEIPKRVIENLKKNGLPQIEGKHATGDILDTIINMSKRNDILIIDVGGGDTEEFRLALSVADLAIFPLKPSILDWDTAPKLVHTLKMASISNKNLVMKTLISDAPTNPLSAITKRFKAQAQETEMLSNIMSTVVKNRDAYKECLEWGLSPRDWKDQKAKAEISSVAQEIIDLFELKVKE